MAKNVAKISALDPNNPSVNSGETSVDITWDGTSSREHLVQKRPMARRTTEGSQVTEGPNRRISTPSMGNVNRGHRSDEEETKRRWEKFKRNFLYFDFLVANNHVRQLFRILSIINILSLLFNSLPPFIDVKSESWKVYYAVLLSVDAFLAVSFTIHLLIRTVNSWYWHRHSLKPVTFTSDHHFSRHSVLFVITTSLWYSVAIESYRLACVIQCTGLWEQEGSLPSQPVRCTNLPSSLQCPPDATVYFPFILRVLSLFSASRVFSIFKQLRIPSSVIKELQRYYLIKHLLNVFIFYVLVVFIYSLIGVHIIGPLSGRCVRESVLNASNFTKGKDNCFEVQNKDDLSQLEPALAVPDFHCPQSDIGKPSNLTSCPSGLVCMCVEVERNLEFQADYPNIGVGFFSVYESSTFELWTRTLYDAIDGENGAEALLFFFTMVFILVFIVESIFLVVIIESFASIRSESYIARTTINQGPNQVLEEQEGRLRLVEKAESVQSYWKTKYRTQWTWFQKGMIVLVLIDAVVMATRAHFTPAGYSCYLFVVSIWQVIVSVVFMVEVFCNLFYFWWRPFFYSVYHWYLTIIAVGSLASAIYEIVDGAVNPHVMCGGVGVSIPPVTPLILFQSLRFIRLVWLYLPLTDFAKLVIGKNSRIFLTVLAVLVFILIFAAINVQLFAFIEPPRGLFDDIFVGYQSQFQLLFQEGWIELLSELILGLNIWWLINIWIIAIYFIASQIILNFFTAIILDNLDLDEETKVEKLKEALEEAHHKEETVPILWKLSTRVGGGPDTVSISQQPGFDGPRIKVSVMKEFFDRGENRRSDGPPSSPDLLSPPPRLRADDEDEFDESLPRLLTREPHLHLLTMPNTTRQRCAWGCRERQQSINDIIYKLKVIRSTRRFDLVESEGEGHAVRKALRVRLSQPHSSRNHGTSHKAIEQLSKDHRCFDRALFCLPPTNVLRKVCRTVLTHQLREPHPTTRTSSSRAVLILNKIKYYTLLVVSLMPYFQWFMGVVLVGLIITQFLEDLCPLTSTDTYRITSDSLFVLFTLSELMLKIVANGLVINPYAAISSIHDVMDWVVVLATGVRIVLIASGAVDSTSYNLWGCPWYAVLLVLWSIRPFRVFSLLPPAREVMSSLWSGRKTLLFAFILFNGFVFAFASLGTQLFSGDLGKCNDPDIKDRGNCTGEFEFSVHLSFDVIFDNPVTNITVPRVWIEEPRDFQFNHIVNSFVTLWSLLPLEGWLVLRDYLDVRANLHGGVDNWLNVVEIKFFLHIYVFIGANIGLALFVGVIVANYNENRSDHAALLTVAQKQWQDLLQRIQLTTPKKIPPLPSYSNKVRYYLYLFVSDSLPFRKFHFLRHFRPFREMELLLILFNACTLAVRWNCSFSNINIAVSFSVVFHACFILETVLKLIAFKGSYFHSVRNILELFLSILSFGFILFAVVVLSMQDKGCELYDALSTVALALAVSRCITILGKYEVLASIVLTILIAIINTIPLLILVMVFLVTYANIGTALFGQIDKGEGINMRHVNFKFHNNSFYLGIRMLTGEDWYQLLWDTAAAPPYCSPDGSNCGQPAVSVLYFLSFFFLTIFVVLNLFRAVLLEAFSVFYNEDDTKLDHTFLKTFRKHWSKFDPTAKGIIPLNNVKFLIRSIGLNEYYTYKVNDAKERVPVDMRFDALVLREVHHELELGISPDQDQLLTEERQEETHSEHQPVVVFSNVLRVVAYKAEDISRRLTPNELKERVLLEQSIQNEVATRCIHLWVKKYVKVVLDHFDPDDGQDILQEDDEQAPVVVPQIIEHQVSLPTDTTEDEGECQPRPQALPLLPNADQVGGAKARKPSVHLTPRVPALTVDPPTQEVDPNHIWFEEQMLIDSEDEGFPL